MNARLRWYFEVLLHRCNLAVNRAGKIMQHLRLPAKDSIDNFRRSKA
ncbi:hypothetical protein RR42_m3385 [Cupriavidus basilensis]|uniref:Uncharacterized protein n=1 Tax=Cupriavidus basilensis TaxID=68895 RepID=A0A0C4YCY5_9BURK|nr:hypothetical protein RR42_m3385 [Cupriavidus basilensis]